MDAAKRNEKISTEEKAKNMFANLRQKGAINKEKDEELEENPILRFGFGISAWIKLLSFLFKLYAGLSILAIILAYYYKSMGNLTGGGRYEFLA